MSSLEIRGHARARSLDCYASSQHQSGRQANQTTAVTVSSRDHGSNQIKIQEAHRLWFRQERATF